MERFFNSYGPRPNAPNPPPAVTPHPLFRYNYPQLLDYVHNVFGFQGPVRAFSRAYHFLAPSEWLVGLKEIYFSEYLLLNIYFLYECVAINDKFIIVDAQIMAPPFRRGR